jgi:hypothetical protein
MAWRAESVNWSSLLTRPVTVSVTGPWVATGGMGVAAGPHAESRIATRAKTDKTSKVVRLCFIFSSPDKIEFVRLAEVTCESLTPYFFFAVEHRREK